MSTASPTLSAAEERPLPLATLHIASPTPSPSAFHSRTFRVFMTGSVLSWLGDWMDLAALNWAVLSLTDSPIALGLINACRLLPVFALSLPAGVLADRHDRRRLLIGLQTGTMLLTFMIGGLIATRAPFWALAALVTVRAIIDAMTPPVRNALLPNLVPRAALPSAVAGQAMLMNLARIVGPAIAGILLSLVPVAWLFWINGLSFAAVLGTLLAIREPRREADSDGLPRAGLREAVAYLTADRTVQSLLILAVVPMVFGFPYTSLMPLFARDLLHLGPRGFGALLSVSACGALAGSGWLSIRGRSERTGRMLIASVLGLGVSLVLFASARGFLPAAAAVFFVGLASQLYRTSSRIALQHHVPDHLRGRILSIALMDRGLIPLGTLLMGAVAQNAGVAWAGLAMGGGCVALSVLMLAARREIWRL